MIESAPFDRPVYLTQFPGAHFRSWKRRAPVPKRYGCCEDTKSSSRFGLGSGISGRVLEDPSRQKKNLRYMCCWFFWHLWTFVDGLKQYLVACPQGRYFSVNPSKNRPCLQRWGPAPTSRKRRKPPWQVWCRCSSPEHPQAPPACQRSWLFASSHGVRILKKWETENTWRSRADTQVEARSIPWICWRWSKNAQ